MERYRRHALVAAACLGTFLSTLDISIVNVALPTLQVALNTDLAGLQWVVNAYAICLSAFMLSAGPLGDRFGHKRVWLVGVVLFTVGSALCAMADTLSVLLIGRAVQGVAGALLIPGALPILTHAFTKPTERAHVIGGWSAFAALALILGPLLGGLLLHAHGWQAIFLINLPLGALTIALGAWGIPERKHPDHAAMDPLGQGLSVLWLGALTYGLIVAGEAGFSSRASWIALLMAAIGFVVFMLVEQRVAKPLLPLAMFRHPPFAAANFASFVLGFSCYSSLFFFSLFLQQIQGWTPVQTGWRMMPQFVATGCMSLCFGRLCARVSVRTLMIAGYGLIGVSMLAMTALSADTPYWVVGTLLALLGMGAGAAVPSTGLAVMASAPPERAGMASATTNALRQTGMAVGIALLGTLMSAHAIRVLTSSVHALGVPDGQPIAVAAITHAVFAPHPSGLRALYTDAMASGFHVAMVVAGLMACLAMFALVLVKPARPLG